MVCVRVNYLIACIILNILFSFFCTEAFSQDRGNVIAELKENYRIVRAENSVRIVRYDGHDNENWYLLELGKNVSDPLTIDKENSKLLRHTLQKCEIDNSALLDAVRKYFSNRVDTAFISFIVSRSGRFEYLYIFLSDSDNHEKNKKLTLEYSDDMYYGFLQWMIGNIELTPWDDPIPYCRGALRAR